MKVFSRAVRAVRGEKDPVEFLKDQALRAYDEDRKHDAKLSMIETFTKMIKKNGLSPNLSKEISQHYKAASSALVNETDKLANTVEAAQNIIQKLVRMNNEIAKELTHCKNLGLKNTHVIEEQLADQNKQLEALQKELKDRMAATAAHQRQYGLNYIKRKWRTLKRIETEITHKSDTIKRIFKRYEKHTKEYEPHMKARRGASVISNFNNRLIATSNIAVNLVKIVENFVVAMIRVELKMEELIKLADKHKNLYQTDLRQDFLLTRRKDLKDKQMEALAIARSEVHLKRVA